MNIKLKPRSSSNGEATKPKWEVDDQLDKLGPAPGEAAEAVASDVKPAVAAVKPAPKPVPKPTPAAKPAPRETIQVKELMETLLEAWTNPTVRMWVDGSDLCFEQVDEETRTKNSWRVGFSRVETSSVKLIK